MWLDLFLILCGVVLTLGTALFVAAEFALVALDQALVEQKIAAGQSEHKATLKALKKLSTQLSGAQVGITLTTILLGYTTQTALGKIFTNWGLAWELNLAIATTIGLFSAAVIVNLASMLFGELIPKNLALADPLKMAARVAPWQMVFTKVMYPLIVVLNGSANWVLKRFGLNAVEELSSARSAPELAALVKHSAQEGMLDEQTATIFTKSVQLGELEAVDVMTHRSSMHWIKAEQSAAEVIALARKTGHSRFPVIGEDIDDVLGIVYLRRAVAVPADKREEVPASSQSLMTPAHRVPQSASLAPVLIELREGGFQMAIVVDEYGGTAGLLTLEDIVEEIVGEVADEHDRRSRTGTRKVGDDWIVPGLLRPDELEELAGLTVPDDGPYETLGGLMMQRLGRIPQVGDKVEVNDIHLKVRRMDGRRIESLLVSPQSPPAEETIVVNLSMEETN
ncbi:hypothetical protein BK816_03565 [Boudabousia tangfeifanii]|uniref:HlyC/CorC family transporter n=1 Tax=Boudabousia tangfeifanii TaxID=1912795 RepID=A0A1D9MJK0_9ACTO|nr:hemolysin family protein [Boudabousia tangfeifanii]AOZ72485.1 hypothetical protein BK816_03565 [Boudabousia tangfeifanii]